MYDVTGWCKRGGGVSEFSTKDDGNNYFQYPEINAKGNKTNERMDLNNCLEMHLLYFKPSMRVLHTFKPLYEFELDIMNLNILALLFRYCTN